MSNSPSAKANRAYYRDLRTKVIKDFCREICFNYEMKTPYQIRIMGVLDLFPTRGKWHYFKNGNNLRGSFDTKEDLTNLFTKLGAESF